MNNSKRPPSPAPAARLPTYGTTYLFNAARSDPAALDALLRRLEPELFRKAGLEMSARLRQRLDPEDVTQSVMMDFAERLRRGQVEFQGSRSLRAMLTQMVLSKVRQRARYHGAGLRDMHQEVALDRAADGRPLDPADDRGAPWLLGPAAASPVTEEEAELLHRIIEDLLQRCEGQLPQEEVIRLTIAGATKEQIARAVERTVKRIEQIQRAALEYVVRRWFSD